MYYTLKYLYIYKSVKVFNVMNLENQEGVTIMSNPNYSLLRLQTYTLWKRHKIQFYKYDLYKLKHLCVALGTYIHMYIVHMVSYMTMIIEENRYVLNRDSRTVAVTSRPFELAQWKKPGNERKYALSH